MFTTRTIHNLKEYVRENLHSKYGEVYKQCKHVVEQSLMSFVEDQEHAIARTSQEIKRMQGDL